MKITVKTLQQKVFTLDSEGTDTIGDLKQKIQESQGHNVDHQKLIYSGKVLPDTKTVESCAIKEKDFLVLMVSKPKAPAASSSTAAAISSPAPAQVPDVPAPAPAVAPAPAPVVPAAPAPTPATPNVPAPAFGDMSSFVSGAQLQTTIDNMIEMGFEREQVMRALRASYNNPDRAAEYLMTGIPAHLEAQAAGTHAQEPQAAPAQGGAPAPAPAGQPAPAPAPAGQHQNLFQLAQQRQQQQGGGGAAPGTGGGGGGGQGGVDLEALRNSPQMQQIREMLTQNPEMLQAVIQQLAQENPALAQTLGNNPEALLQLLQNEGDEGAVPPGATVVHVTPEEQASIERLQALGFPRQTVLEAYFACDKNEELAANYLFENGFED